MLFLNLNNLELKCSVAVSEICLWLVFIGSLEETDLDLWSTWFLEFRDCQQITFVTLGRFCLLSKNTPTSCPQRTTWRWSEYRPKSNEIYMLFLHCILFSFEGSNNQKGCTTSPSLLWKTHNSLDNYFLFLKFQQ